MTHNADHLLRGTVFLVRQPLPDSAKSRKRVSIQSIKSIIMAPRLSKAHHEQILSMILRGYSNENIGESVPCTTRAVRRARSTHSRFGTTTVPSSRTGPDPTITPVIATQIDNHTCGWQNPLNNLHATTSERESRDGSVIRTELKAGVVVAKSYIEVRCFRF